MYKRQVLVDLRHPVKRKYIVLHLQSQVLMYSRSRPQAVNMGIISGKRPPMAVVKQDGPVSEMQVERNQISLGL